MSSDGQCLTIGLRVDDGQGGSDTVKCTLAIANLNPLAEANGPYVVDEGLSLVLDGSGSTDPGDDQLTYEWDLDGDGVFGETGAVAANGDETGVAPVFSAALLDGPDTRIVTLRVTDADAATAEDVATISVLNVAPTIVLSGAGSVNEGATYTLALGPVTDPGDDTLTDYVVNWGDGADQPDRSRSSGEPRRHPHVRRRAGRAHDHRRLDRRGRNSHHGGQFRRHGRQHRSDDRAYRRR